MLEPSGVSVSSFISYIRSDNRNHVKIEFIGQGITLNDNDIDASGITISSYMNGETDLTIGSTMMTEVSIPVIRGEWNEHIIDSIRWNGSFWLYFGVENGSGTTKWVKIGKYNGTKPNKYVGNDIITYVAYDNMKRFEISAEEFLRNNEEEQELCVFFQKLCVYCGVPVYIDYDKVDPPHPQWPGDMLYNIGTRQIKGTLFNKNITCRTLLSAIAEASGCYAVINADGKLDLRWYRDHRSDYTLLDSDELSLNSFEYIAGQTWKDLESYTWEDLESYSWLDFEDSYNMIKINGMKIQSSNDDIGVYYPGTINGNIYVIEDNPILFINSDSDVQQYVKPLYDRLVSLPNYLPISLNCIGNPLVEVGDIINVNVNGSVVSMPIFNIVRRWNGSMTDTYETTGQINRDIVSVTDVETMSTDTSYHKFTNNYETLFSEIRNLTDDYTSTFQQLENLFLLGLVNGAHYARLRLDSGIQLQTDQALGLESQNLSTTDNGLKVSGMYALDSEYAFIYPHNIGFYLKNSGNPNKAYNQFVIGINDDNSYIHTGAEQNIFIRSPDNSSDPYIAIEMSQLIGAQQYDYTGLMIEMGTAVPLQPNKRHIIIKPYYAGTSGSIGTVGNVWDTAYISRVYADSYNNLSSVEAKHDIDELEDCGEQLDKLKPVRFIYNHDRNGRKRYGLIYEDTVDVVPDICHDEDGMKSVNYIDLIPMLLKEIQSLRQRVAELEDKQKGR